MTRTLYSIILPIFASGMVASAATYASYVGEVNGSPADPLTQGWSISGGRTGPIDDNGVLGWKLEDRNKNSNPTMSADYGAANIPQPGDPWSFSVTTRVLPGNGTECNQIQWSNGTIRYHIFVYEDSSGNIDLRYSDTGGSATTLDNYITNDGAYHSWAIVHDGFGAKITCDGTDVVGIGPVAADGAARGVSTGGGSKNGRGTLYVSGALYEATLGSTITTTHLARIFGDHMVLQRGKAVAVFGSDEVNPGGQTVTVSFGGQTKIATTDLTGFWRVDLDPMSANSTGQELVVTGSSTVTLSNVLVGEIWLAAGQENMNFSVGESSNPPHSSTYPLVRMCNWEGTVGTGSLQVYGAAEFSLLDSGNFYAGTWQELDATSVLPQSAVAYFFAHDLAAALNVPVGVVDISVDGTSTEAYIPAAVQSADFLLRIPFEKPDRSPALGQWTTGRIAQNLGTYTHGSPDKPHPHPFAPGFLHESGLAGIAPFTFKGVLWYQGESNAAFSTNRHARNGKWISDYQFHVLRTLVDSWRSALENPDLPFYQVQLPRIDDPVRNKWPWYREAQQRLSTELAGVETAIITEFGAAGPESRPADKEPVGQRLARIARANLYGHPLEPSGPVCTGHTISGDRIILQFSHLGGGLISRDGTALRQFEIAGTDRNFVSATATIVGNTVEVTTPAVPAPVAVRHAWEMNPDVNLFNDNDVDLSAGPFRTDDWMVVDLGRPIRVACIGDSITAGEGIADPADTYPAQFQSLLGTTRFEVRNFGLPGAMIYTTAAKYESSAEFADALAFNPDVVICNLGLNDVNEWGQYTQDGFLTEYEHLIAAFAALDTDPLMVIWHEIAPVFLPITGSPELLGLIDMIGDCASYMGVYHLDMSKPLKDHEEWFISDGIHPNPTGARKIAEETFLLLESLDGMDPQLLLSEFMTSNTSTLGDEDGDFSPWLEITNQGSTGAVLGGLYLTNDMGNLTRWQIPPGTFLEPASAMIVFASGKDRAVTDSEFHTNFGLSGTGGSLAMVAGDGVTILDAHDPYPSQYEDRSYGRAGIPSNGSLVFFPTPTPGSANEPGGLKPLANWKDIYSVGTESEDLDHDGISAILEFINGTRPDSASSVHIPVPLVTREDDLDYFGIRFRIANGLPGLTFELESLEELFTHSETSASAPQFMEVNWAIVVGDPVLVSSQDNGDGSSTLTYRLATPMSATASLLLRVRFAYSEE